MMINPKNFTIRVPEETLEKFRYVAKYDDRSMSGQIVYLIHQNIRDFEKEHGAIELEKKEEE